VSVTTSTRIVLVHGLAGSSRWWRHVVPHLDGFAVEYADPRQPLDADDAVLVGHSLGGLRAAQYATQHPVQKLVLVAPVGLPWPNPIGLVGSTTARHWARVWLDAARWGPSGMLRGGVDALTTRIDPRAITAPTLIVWGERDRLVSVRYAEQWHGAIAGSRLAIIPRARHVPMLEEPSAFAEVLLDFLRDE
jgi:pimeloyl-ACP methyl ester carboxylesterase